MGNNESKKAEKLSDEHRVRSVVRQSDLKRPEKGSDEQGTSDGYTAGDVRHGVSRESEEGAGHHEGGDVKHRSDDKSLTKSSDEPGASSGGEISRPDKVYTEGECM